MPDELIVVDDASSYGSRALAQQAGVRLVRVEQGPRGLAYARNRGAEAASGDMLVFVDADVAVHSDTLARIERTFAEEPQLDALFGSYDDQPQAEGLVSRYKNLLHHYVHQHGQRRASTFWAGCGAIRRQLFLACGGFDESYERPCIEDIELGVRLRSAGYRIRLCQDVQVTHLKRWTLAGLLRSDIRDRAVPWTRLILREKSFPSDLNLSAAGRVSAVAAWGGLFGLLFGFWQAWTGVLGLLSLMLLVALNAKLYHFFARHGGVRFAAGAAALHALYLLYSSAVFGTLVGAHLATSLSRTLIRRTWSRRRSAPSRDPEGSGKRRTSHSSA